MTINTDPIRTNPSLPPSWNPLPGASSSSPSGIKPSIMHPHHVNFHAMNSMSESNVWAGIMFFMLVAGVVKLLLFRFWTGSLLLLFSTSFLMSTYYAKRPRITHPLASFLCAVFFVTFRDKTTGRPVRRFLRLSVAFAISILNFLFVMH
jgi:hypothetical protein